MDEVKEVKEESGQTGTLPLEVLNEVLGYLSTKPFNEVSKLIQIMQSEVKINE